jgi:glycosyltransferase involved in cell wall biosynthesis
VIVPFYNLAEFLPEALDALAAQTWPNLDVLVIDDGSTDPAAVRVFDEQQQKFPQFRFLRQPNAGIGATRNRGLREARGEYVVCVDADNVAHPRMIEQFVVGMQQRPDCSALGCYYLAFRDSAALARGTFAYAYRPTGGPYVLASLRNVYGDANSIYRLADFLAVGGFEEDRDTSFEDWEAFVKLARAGYRVDVLPEHLFYYRHRDEGFSRATNAYRNRQRVLRQFPGDAHLPLAERMAIWTAVAGLQHGQEHLRAELRSLRYRVADRVHRWLTRVPGVRRLVSFLRSLTLPARQVRRCES